MPQPSSASKDRPASLGRYELLAHLASGGMAEVWLARMTGAKGLGRFFALKRMHRTLASQEKFVRMFLDEAEVASHVQHPNVVPIFELGEEDGELFLVMELVVGVSLSTLLARSADRSDRIPIEAVTQILCDTALGLHAAHTATSPDGKALGIVHRDVSPQNVLVGVDGRSRVVDFGIAKALMRTTETQTGELKGKLSYYSPEQALAKPLDARSDVFALGIVLWEALVGQRLFRSDSPLDTLRRITQDTIPNPSDCAPVPAAIGRVALHALARELPARIPSALAFEAELRAAALASGIAPGPQHVIAAVERDAGDKVGALRSLVSRRWTERHALESGAVALGAGGALLDNIELTSESGVRMSDTLVTPPTIAISRPALLVDGLAQTGVIPGSMDEPAPPRRAGAPIVLAIVLGLAAAGGGGSLAWVLTSGDDAPPTLSPVEPTGATLGTERSTVGGATPTTAPTGSGAMGTTPPLPQPTAVTPVTPIGATPTGSATTTGQTGPRTQRNARTGRSSRVVPGIVAPSIPPLRVSLPTTEPRPARQTPIVTQPTRPVIRPTPTPTPRPTPTPTPTPRRGVVRDYDED